MKASKYILFLLLVPIVQSCFKEDDKVLPHVQGNILTDTIGMSQDYKNQVYFDLGTGSVVATNQKTDWDLGFECSPEGWRIILNTSNFMKSSDAGIIPFTQELDTAGRSWYFDKSDGNPDSTAIGKWFTLAGTDTVSNQHVYILDRGMDPNGDPLGFRQIIFDSLKNNTYYFRIAFLDGGSPVAYSITKDPECNYIFFTFRFGGKVQKLEPPKTDYDLLFTQYTTILYTDVGDPYPYLVTGVLLNRNGVMAIQDTVHSFQTLTLEEAKTLTFSSALDEIGYNWKYYNFDLAVYSVLTNKLYVIRDTEGYYYKLRFIGFYNAQGEKGYPVMEFQRL